MMKYTKTHEWIKFEGDNALIGITDYAQNELGDLVFINLPLEGDSVEAGEAFADVESVKAVSDVISPVSAKVLRVNEELCDAPEMVNEAADETWFIEVSDITDEEELMTADEYADFLKQEGE